MKKIVAIFISAVFIAVMLVAEQPLIKAQPQHHYTATIGYDGPDYFSECVHTDNGENDDCFVGLGMSAKYDEDLWDEYEQVAYNEAAWSFRAGYGGGDGEPTWRFYIVPICMYAINQYGYYQGTQFYSDGVPYAVGNSWIIDDYYPGPSLTDYISLNPDASAIRGQSYEAFYEYSNPSNIQYLSAAPTGGYYNIMTASPPPKQYYDVYYP
jgi:hypothetical protein